MSRSRAESAECEVPELMLRKATLARTAGLRAKYARRGLELAASSDPTVRSLLLRQLYLVAMERRRFSEARELSHQMLVLDVMTDAAHQDAARACLGQKDIDGAVRHLRLAARTGPKGRRAFHLSMLGSVLYLNGRAVESLSVLRLAARWSTTDKAICRAQLLLAEIEARVEGATPESLREELEELREALEQAPHRRGYADFILGELCSLLGDTISARAYLEEFLVRTTSGRVALRVALDAEIRRAKSRLSRLRNVSAGE